MKKYIVFAAIFVLVISGLVVSQGFNRIRVFLTGYEEVPSLSTPANGRFNARIRNNDTIDWELSYEETESAVTQAHIHFGNVSVNGGISVWLCGNPSPTITPPAGTQLCPPAPATISGTIDSIDVVGPAGQGIAPGEFDELVAAIRAGSTYVNVHTVGRPGGEIRSQINSRGFGHRHGDDDDDDGAKDAKAK